MDAELSNEELADFIDDCGDKYERMGVRDGSTAKLRQVARRLRESVPREQGRKLQVAAEFFVHNRHDPVAAHMLHEAIDKYAAATPSPLTQTEKG